MKKIFLTLTLLCCFGSIFAKSYETKFSQQADNYLVSFEINPSDVNVKDIILNGESFSKIMFNVSTVTEKQGWAELPFIGTAIQIPADKNFDLEVVSSNYYEILLNSPLVPSRGVIYRNQEPATIPYVIDPASVVNSYYPGNIARAEEPYIIRDVRGTSVYAYPFQYNAATNTLRVYTNINVRLTPNNEVATNPLLKENPTPVREAIGMYKSLFINFDETKYDLPMAQFGEILVITTARDEAGIEPYIQWKKEKGYIVHKEVVATGTNVKTLIQSQYNANNNILYVQLVGDWADIKSDNSIDSAPTDPKMGCVVGTDNFPEIAIGRFSCNDDAQLAVQINKAINYEKSPNMEANWHEAYTGIASSQGAGTGDDGEIDYTHIQRIFTERLESPIFTYLTHNQNYEPSASATVLASHINAGTSAIAYCGHGSETSFVTTGFNNSNVNQLTNGDKLPFITSVACVNGAFHISSDCFAEAWLKKENGGAVVTWMSTINQPWTPPMRGEDYFYDILIGGFDYAQWSGQNGITTTEQRTTWGSITVNAFNLMLTESQTSSDIETAHTWTTFGDVTLQLRTVQPATLVSSNPTIVVGLPYETTITANGDPIENALVCISQNDTYFSGITDENGMVSIENTCQPGELLLVVTAFNTTTIYENIECIPAEGSYLIQDGYTLAGDGILSSGETSFLSLAIKNVGSDPTTSNTTVTISCENDLLTINDATEVYGPIASGESLTVNNGFQITASEDITNGQAFMIHVTAVNGTNTWESNFIVKAYKVLVNYSSMSWPGVFTPGEDLTLQIFFANEGGYSAFNAEATLSCSSEYVTINTPTVSYGTIAPSGTVSGAFNITISGDTPTTEPLDFTVALTADNGITAQGQFSLKNSCNVVFDMFDSYGDGWNGASLTVAFNDGSQSQNLTFTSGDEISYTLEIGSGVGVTVNFNSGSWNSECSFNIYYESGDMIYASTGTPQAGVQCTFVCSCGGSANVCDPVTNLDGTASGTTVSLSWTAPEGADYYYVSENGVTIGTPNTNNFTYENAASGTNNYCVSAFYDETGCTSVPTCIALNVQLEQCDAPENISATAAQLIPTIAISWAGVEEAVEYKLYRDNTEVTTTTALSYSDENLNYATEYCYHVVTICGNGSSTPSTSACATTVECYTPASLNTNASGNTISVDWTPAQNATTYVLYRNDEQIAELTEYTYSDSALEFNTEYCYKVAAKCNETLSEFSNTDCSTTACAAPTSLTAEQIPGQMVAVVSWTASTGAESYNLYRNGELLTTVTETSFNDETIPEGHICYYVTAVNINGESDSSNEACLDIQGISNNNAYNVNVFPNPTKDLLYVECEGMNEIQLYSMSGKLLKSVKVSAPNKVINISNLPAGIYQIGVITENNVTIKKIVKE